MINDSNKKYQLDLLCTLTTLLNLCFHKMILFNSRSRNPFRSFKGSNDAFSSGLYQNYSSKLF